MAGPIRESRVTAADRRHFDFMKTLLRISDELTEEETANFKLFCLHLIPKGQLAQLRRAMDVFVKLMELDKIDQENLEFIEEILEGIGRQDLIRDVLRRFQPPDREIPENPELQPENPELQPENAEVQSENPELQQGTSQDGTNEDVNATSNTYVVVHGPMRMVQEVLDQLKNCLATLCGIRRSQVKFRGYKKHKSILVHFSIPRENTAVLRHMADHSDPRLVYMGVKSVQIDAEVPIKVQQEAPEYDFKRKLSVDDIQVGCSTRTKHQRAPQGWTRLSALNLFSDALPLHLQAAASLEYQGFSYSLVRALVQKDRLREHQMRQAIQNLRNAEVDSNTIMTLRSKLNITENRLKEALETIAVLEEKLQQAQEYAEKAVKQVASHVVEYRGEKPHGGWPQEYRGEKPPGGWPQGYRGEKPPGGRPAQAEKADAATQRHLAGPVGTTWKPEVVGEKPGEDTTVRMAGPVRETVTAADRRHFDFVQTLLRISHQLTEEETANLKIFCLHLLPRGHLAQLGQAMDVFVKLMELDKIDMDNLEFTEEILERIGRQDLVRDVLWRFQPPKMEIPENPEHPLENPELRAGTSQEGANVEGNAASSTYVVVPGQMRMIQETLDHLRNSLATLSGTRRSQVRRQVFCYLCSLGRQVGMPSRQDHRTEHGLRNASDPRRGKVRTAGGTSVTCQGHGSPRRYSPQDPQSTQASPPRQGSSTGGVRWTSNNNCKNIIMLVLSSRMQLGSCYIL
uniref:DED domain-containing protein n=1 Tax=Branchiostoma floridae TaxID=7739 RepID=C3ZU78_BRAFL|eukprot:XP_002587953.1 hypothetical protein BRAFLDRAFT_87341 [Branchiostoma floridae]